MKLENISMTPKFLYLLAAGTALLLSASAPSVFAAEFSSKEVLIFDGIKQRNYQPKVKLDEGETSIVKEQALAEAVKLWKDEFQPAFKIIDVSKGAFTKKNAAQKLVLYQFNNSAPVYVYGLAVLQDGKLVAHYCYKGAYTLGLLSLPDFTNDGLNEAAIQTMPMHQGFLHGYSQIIKLQANDVKKFGQFEFWDDNIGAGAGQTKQYLHAYKIYAIPGKNPQFRRQKCSSSGLKWNCSSGEVTYKPKEDNIEYLLPQ